MLNVRAMFKRKNKVTLQLTSLLDMFTIILVFLMVSFQAEDKDFVLHPGLELPASSAKNPFKTAVNIAISQDAVIVNGQTAYELEDGGRVKAGDLRKGKAEAIANAVAEAWEAQKKDLDEENVVVVQADRRLPYQTIHFVVRSAAYSGFFRYRLVIEKE